MATNEIPNLHEDIIFLEILPRLPAKSLTKFSSVSKSWLSLISSNQFIKTHLRNTSKLHQRIMIKHPIKLECCVCDVESMFANEPLLDAVDTKYLFDSSTKSVSFMGSCDGMICIVVDERDLILWNPSTTKFKKLPSLGTFGKFSTCGLGFDKETDDYKVVVFSYTSNIVKVYSLRTNEWRSVEKLGGKLFTVDPPVFANGKLHWVSLSGLEWEIVTFDMATEEYGVLKVQDFVEIYLCASEECPYVLSDNADVWIIGDYELGRLTCTKLATIPFKGIFRLPVYVLSDNFTHADAWIIEDCELGKLTFTKLAAMSYEVIFNPGQPVYVYKNDEILLQYGDKFAVFNMKDSKIKSLDITLPYYCGRGVTYVESLVSPFV